MAMTKREQLEFGSLKWQLRVAKAFRFTPKVEIDVEPPNHSEGGLSVGFTYNSSRSDFRVQPACSSCVSHGIGSQTKVTSQHSIGLYSTEAMAYRALRHDLEQKYANDLAMVDLKIEELERKDS